jgi:hypothetical protein
VEGGGFGFLLHAVSAMLATARLPVAAIAILTRRITPHPRDAAGPQMPLRHAGSGSAVNLTGSMDLGAIFNAVANLH